MMNDTVREELETKIGRNSGQLDGEKLPEKTPAKPARPEMVPAAAAARIAPRPETRHIASRHTSQTLVEFQNRNAAVPEWRLELQNVVRKRAAGVDTPSAESSPAQQRPSAPAAVHTEIGTSGAAANERVASALRRVEASRKAFLPPSAARAFPTPARPSTPIRNFHLNVVSRTADSPVSRPPEVREMSAPPKPTLVPQVEVKKNGFDTNKLPPLSEIIEKSPVSAPETQTAKEVEPAPFKQAIPLAIETTESPIILDTPESEPDFEREFDEVDDLATFSMRFGSGLFDMIIVGFAALIILSPLLVDGGPWFTLTGILTFVGSLAILSFLYSTAAIGIWGCTLGMRIFSLELIDSEENAYPSIQQAALNSAVFLVSFAFAGAGFLTIPFSRERRALHDIASRTIMVREM